MENIKCGAVIVAAGRGKRMKSPIDKQFIELGGRTILERTVEKFEKNPCVNQIVIVTGKDHVKELEKINDNTCSIISYINSIIFALVIPMVCHTKEQLL